MSVCTKCNRSLPENQFYATSRWCKDCRRDYYSGRKEHTRLQRIERLYNVTPEQYLEMAKNGCHICGSFERLHVDHDHSCCNSGDSCGKCVRGVLCHTHNRALGLFQDDPGALLAAAEYLSR